MPLSAFPLSACYSPIISPFQLVQASFFPPTQKVIKKKKEEKEAEAEEEGREGGRVAAHPHDGLMGQQSQRVILWLQVISTQLLVKHGGRRRSL